MKPGPIKIHGGGVEYRLVPGFPGYRAGSDGSVWTCWKFHGAGYGRKGEWRQSQDWHQLQPECREEDGRKRYNLKRADGKRVRKYGGHFVLLAFFGPCPDGMECCHRDGDCTNDAADNVRWDTVAANKADMVAHGTRLRGEQINTAKLTEDAVREIRRTGYPLRPLAKRFGVSETVISLVLRRKAWQHVD